MDVTTIVKSLLPPYGALKGSRRPLVAICVGHSRKGDSGACSASGASEWTYNKQVAEYLRADLEKRNINAVVFTTYDGKGYTGAMTWLATQLELLKVDFAVELHFNSADSGAARGFEFLYWRTSKKGQGIASLFQQTFKKNFPDNLSRGSKGLSKDDRGGLFVRLPSMPCVILEPFFGSNIREWELFGTEAGQKRLGETYGEAIEQSSRFLGL
jgi:N-acetylmuramoyl-L-alanine amidase